MKTLTVCLQSIILCLLLCACSEDDPGPADSYDLTVLNNSAEDLTIYMSSGANDSGFLNFGNVDSGGSILIEDLEPTVTYTLRATLPGGTIDSPYYETSVTGDADTSVSID